MSEIVSRAKAKPTAGGGIVETVKTIVYAVLIAVGVRTVAFEPFNIPSGSMIPSLLVGDYLFVSKYSYGYSRYSLPFGLPLLSGRIFFTEPERGDVIVFKLPSDNATDYIKRLVGMPGDRVQVQQGRLYINGKIVPREEVGAVQYQKDGFGPVPVREFVETLPNGRKHRIYETTDTSIFDNTREFVVPPGHYFMMGDNRDDSLDSRAAVGYVPAVNLVGRAEFIFFSIEGRFFEIWKWPFTIRYERLFRGIK